MADITANWPLIVAACERRGFWDAENAAAIAGTVAIETAHSFEPVMEAYYLFGSPFDYDKDACWGYLRRTVRYWPFPGQGFIQSTWEAEYKRLERETGIPVHQNPRLALVPEYAAEFLASFWEYKNIAPYARRRDWETVRYRVQGGDSSLGELITFANGLLAL